MDGIANKQDHSITFPTPQTLAISPSPRGILPWAETAWPAPGTRNDNDDGGDVSAEWTWFAIEPDVLQGFIVNFHLDHKHLNTQRTRIVKPLRCVPRAHAPN